MKLQSHEDVCAAVDEILNLKNWTSLTLSELAAAGRVVPDSPLDGWINHWYAENDLLAGGFYYGRVIEVLREKVKALNEHG